MSKYKVVTDKGTFIVETEDAPAPSRGTVTVDQAKAEFDKQRMDNRTTGQVLKDSVLNNLEGVGQFVAGIPGMAVETAKIANDAFNPVGGLQRNVNRGMALTEGAKDTLGTLAPLAHDAAVLTAPFYGGKPSDYAPTSTPEQQRGYQNFAGQNAGGLITGGALSKVGPVARALSEAIPSKARAGVNFQKVMGVARNEPLSLGLADDAALRAQELAGRGSTPGRGHSLPKVVRDYLRTRESSPTMTYEVGRDFQSSAGKLSAAESMATKGPMRAEVSKLAKALADSNRQAAVKAGMGPEYDAAMREYRIASMKDSTIDALAKALKNRAVQTAVGGGAAYGAYKALSK